MRFVLVLGLALALLGASSAAPAGASEPEPALRSTLEQQVLYEVNRSRRARGLRPLWPASGLRAAALYHSRAMLRLGFVSHDSPDGTTFEERLRRFYPERGWRTWSVAETLLVATRPIRAREVVAAWIDSPSHKDVLFSSTWREIGVGTTTAASGPGEFRNLPTVLVTADFGVRG